MSPKKQATKSGSARKAKPKAAAKRPAARKSAAKPAARATARAGSKPAARAARPGGRLGIVAKAPPRPAARSFPQTEGASSKQLIVFRLLKARAQLLAALQGLVAGVAEVPLGEGKWTVREIVLHLCCRDRVRLREFEAALRGVQASWRGLDAATQDRINAEHIQPISHLAWDEAQRLLHSTRQSLMDAIDGVPEEPIEVWQPDHAFGWMLAGLPAHDQHHAEIIKQWRADSGA